MELRVLEYFLTVVREENITKAADILHITQPTLSRQLAKFEEELGAQLFVRGKKGITLTEQGILLRRRAAELVELAEKTEHEIANREQLIEGEIVIGSGELESVKLLPAVFKTFKEKYPRITFEIYTGDADQIKERLDNGLVDFGILLEPVAIDKYDFIRLDVKERWVILMRTDNPLASNQVITAEDIAGIPLIMPKRLRYELENWLKGYTDKLNIVTISTMSTNASVLVAQGFGNALIIEGSVPYIDTSKICCRPIFPERTTTSVFAWKKNLPSSPAVRKFTEFIREFLKTSNVNNI